MVTWMVESASRRMPSFSITWRTAGTRNGFSSTGSMVRPWRSPSRRASSVSTALSPLISWIGHLNPATASAGMTSSPSRPSIPGSRKMTSGVTRSRASIIAAKVSKRCALRPRSSHTLATIRQMPGLVSRMKQIGCGFRRRARVHGDDIRPRAQHVPNRFIHCSHRAFASDPSEPVMVKLPKRR